MLIKILRELLHYFAQFAKILLNTIFNIYGIPVKAECHFGLIRVKMMHPDARDGFNIGRILSKDVFVKFYTRPHRTQTFLYPENIKSKFHFF